MSTSGCFQIFHQLFVSESIHLNETLNAKLINAFYDYQPSENDPQQLIAWLNVIEAAFKNLNRFVN
jgi:ribosomal RNA-processing protein 12